MFISNPFVHCCKDETRLLQENGNEILRDNLSMLQRLISIALVVLSFCLIVSIFAHGYAHRRPAYIIAISCCLLLYALFRLGWCQRHAMAGIYIIFGIFLGLTIFLSVVISPTTMAASIIGLFCLMPSSVLDKSWRVTAMTTLFWMVHLLFAWRMKPPAVAMDDTVNGLCFIILGILIGAYMRRVKLENYEMKRQAHIQMDMDFLTGLYNRRKLFQLLEQHRKGCVQRPIAGFIMLDIDHFKEYNDHCGHLAGDDCLRKISQCLRESARELSLDFFRYGGEEFLAFYYVDSPSDIAQLAQMLRQLVWELNLPFIHCPAGRVTVSVGYACACQNDGCADDKLIGMADKALYCAKESGRNCAVAYTP